MFEILDNLTKTNPSLLEFAIFAYCCLLSWKDRDSVVELTYPTPGFQIGAKKTLEALHALRDKGFLHILKDGSRLTEKHFVLELLNPLVEGKPKSICSSREKEILAYFCEKYEEKLGAKYVHDERKDISLLRRRILGEFGLSEEEVRRMLDLMLDSPEILSAGMTPSISLLAIPWIANKLFLLSQQKSKNWESKEIAKRRLNEIP